MIRFNNTLVLWDKFPQKVAAHQRESWISKQFNMLGIHLGDASIVVDASKILLDAPGMLQMEIDGKPLLEFDSIVVLGSLQWRGHEREYFLGFDIVGSLRMQGVVCPVFICSDREKASLLEITAPKFQCLRVPGHYYVQMVGEGKLVKDYTWGVEPMSPNLIVDFQYFFMNPHGRVDEIFHSKFKNEARNNQDRLEEITAEGMLAIEVLIPKTKEAMEAIQAVKAKFRQGIDEGKEIWTVGFLEEIRKDVYNIIPNPDAVPNPPKVQDAWGVLFADDDPADLIQVKDILEAAGIKCFTARTGKEAIQMLEADAAGKLEAGKVNFITVFICDWRFEQAVHGHYKELQAMQGPDIIDHVYYKLRNMMSFFMVTSKKGAILKELRGNLGVQMHWFLKQDMFGAGKRMFIDKVLEEGKQMFEALIHRPELDAWTAVRDNLQYRYCDLYRWHRLSSDYAETEARINERANSFVLQAMRVKRKLQQRVVVGDIRDYEFSGTMKWTNALGKKVATADLAVVHPKIMKKFVTKLMGRRIAIALSQTGFKASEIISIMRHLGFGFQAAEFRMMANTFLALSVVDTDGDQPVNTSDILVEEQAWLRSFEVRVEKQGFVERVRNVAIELQHQFPAEFPAGFSPNEYVPVSTLRETIRGLGAVGEASFQNRFRLSLVDLVAKELEFNS